MWHTRHLAIRFLLLAAFNPLLVGYATAAEPWDVQSDTWVATDALGRRLPTAEEAGLPRVGKTVGIFYFLWLGESGDEGPFDISKILAADPKAINDPKSPLWGPLWAPHHWGESIFGHYRSNDESVLRKHAQMLSDAGVDFVVFDVTNQLTYPRSWQALCRVFDQVRREGNRAPQIAFLCPFGDPQHVVRELWNQLYGRGLYPDLWFRWEGKPLILADPTLLGERLGTDAVKMIPSELSPNHTFGQTFTTDKPFDHVDVRLATWGRTDLAATLALYKEGSKGKQLISRRLEKIIDNGWHTLKPDSPLPPGTYYLELAEPTGTVAWWSTEQDLLPGGTAHSDRMVVDGDRAIRISLRDGPTSDVFTSCEQAEPTTAIELLPNHTLGQTFTIDQSLDRILVQLPTYNNKDSAVTLSLYQEGPKGKRLVSRRLEKIADNAWHTLEPASVLLPGMYYLELSEPKGKVGWYSFTKDRFPCGTAYSDGTAIMGDRTLQLYLHTKRDDQIRQFFTFRKPQPDYFQGPTGPNQWGWLEVYPQHAFYKTPGVAEQVTVGIAQNAVDGKLSVFSAPGSYGRSFHEGKQPEPDKQDATGRNFSEQWNHALKLDPAVVFVTGWNEWFAGRLPSTFPMHKVGPVGFCDEFTPEGSRDIEPMKGGHGDNYYYQLISYVRQYKGARPLPAVEPRPIAIDGQFDDWKNAQPEYRDTIGDPVHRDHPGWGKQLHYANQTGRNDIVTAKVSYDDQNVYFYVHTSEKLTPSTDPNWMLLFLDVDNNPQTGWLGYDVVINRKVAGPEGTSLQRNIGGKYEWGPPVSIRYRTAGNDLELAIPRALLGIQSLPAILDFKWADNLQETGDWSDFTLNGDAAPNDRFNYRSKLK